MLKKITVLYNLPGENTTQNITEADDDTEKSALNIVEGLKTLGYETEIMGITRQDIGKVSRIEADLVFNMIEWSGRECEYAVSVLEILEKKHIPFTGSDAVGYMLSCNKIAMKKKMDQFMIPTPKWLSVNSSEILPVENLNFPLIAKPASEHCAIGVSQKSVVNNDQELRDLIVELYNLYKQPILIEEYIDGLEAHVTVLEKNGEPWVLPPAVIEWKKTEGYKAILTYEAKWKDDSVEANLSEWAADDRLSKDVQTKIRDLAGVTFQKLGGRSYSRIDMRIRGEEVLVLEINNNPGIDFHPESGIAHSASKAGLEWLGLLQNIVTESYAHPVI
jgi:D-alanine-D-alanine ligase